jgi:biopolymer transport protein ExbD
MAIKCFSFERDSAVSFNMTPVIDIVFLLILFFALVFKFIEAENFPVAVPEGCRFAQNEIDSQAALATVTVMKNEAGRSDFAVGAEKVTGADYEEISGRLAGLIDLRLKNLPVDKRVVTLRIDKDIPYAEAQYALAAVAKSTATDIRLAAIKDSPVAR